MPTYTTLQADIQDRIENDDAAFIAAIPTIISIAELRIYRDLEIIAFAGSVTGTITGGAFTVPRPSDMLRPKSLSIVSGTSGTSRVTLQYREQEFIFEYWPDATLTGIPKYYAEQDVSTFIVAPTPAVNTSYTLWYNKRDTALSAGGGTWLLTYAYDALLAGCCAEAGRYVIDDRQAGLIAMYEAMYKGAVDALNGLDMRADRDGGSLPTNDLGVSNG